MINNGAHIVMNGANANIYIDGASGNYTSQAGGLIDPLTIGPTITLLGNWVNNSANIGFSFDGSTVNFAGAAQTLGGTNFTHFYNVNLSGSGTKTLLTQERVGGFGGLPIGVLSLGTRPLDLNGSDLWVFNPNAGAITNSTGYIISETNASLNPSQVRWLIGTNTGTRVIPFGTIGGVQIPLTMNTTTAMSSSTSYFIAATRPTPGSNNVPWASGVTQMYDPTLLQDGSDEAVIDRWWELTYSDAATSTITFSYSGAENTLITPYNTGNLGAQYWLGGWIPDNSNIGSAPAVLAGVGTVTAPGIPFLAATYQPMVLSSLSAPLPVELISFKSNCSNGRELLSWATASEINNDYFTVERSDDGISFRDIGTVAGAGTSSQQHNYSFTDPEPVAATIYYRLRQTDFNGHTTNSSIIAAETCGSTVEYIDAYSAGDGVNVVMNIAQQTDYDVAVFDACGSVIIDQNISATEGSNHFLLNGIIPATGVYMIRVTGNNGKTFSKRLLITKD
ncbi:MAG TPA: T9SS type A sorting domain-containing protein [Bacteroidia bacterium]|nr:T9SS type A sorting domain-containing protein [Bacteroidia bacterium]